MRLARWRDSDQIEWVGTEASGSLTPLRRSGPGAEGDRTLIELARSGSAAEAVAPEVRVTDVQLLAPITNPGAMRDFMAFEAHVATARAARGLEMDAAWYEVPVFYFTNPHTVIAPGSDVPHPTTNALDYELEVGIVIGAEIHDVTPEAALAAIAGYTIYNDFSARDTQRTEMRLGLGPSKAKDFAQGLGPVLVTPDELDGPRDRPRATMVARVNGTEWSRGDLADLHHPVGQLVAHAARDSRLRPGDVIGTGTVGTGCLLERNATAAEAAEPVWLAPGDVVELEVTGIGVLRHRIGEPRVR